MVLDFQGGSLVITKVLRRGKWEGQMSKCDNGSRGQSAAAMSQGIQAASISRERQRNECPGGTHPFTPGKLISDFCSPEP